jgi:hypothetical protein
MILGFICGAKVNKNNKSLFAKVIATLLQLDQ